MTLEVLFGKQSSISVKAKKQKSFKCPQLALSLELNTYRHVNKGYVCMYVCM